MNVIERFIVTTISVCIVAMSMTGSVAAGEFVDTDGDGLSDLDEIRVFGTDPRNRDTDRDGYSDGEEIGAGYSPTAGKKRLLSITDTDHDGLNDAFELAFGADIRNRDSDGDGFADYFEIQQGYDPRTAEGKKVEKRIVIHLAKQRLTYYVNDIRLDEAAISTGKWNTPTPRGEFTVGNKNKKAWSKMAELWMPYWMGLEGRGIKSGAYGIHELPVWPNGYREGENHLGKPASHGCIRLGLKTAKKMYELTPVGTHVTIR